MITVSKKGFPKKSEVDKKVARLISDRNVIYCLYFPESDKMYIGQTQDFWTRMSAYRASIKLGRLEQNQEKLYNAIVKYDYKFTLTILAMNVKDEDLDDTETSYIDMFDTFKNGYNMTRGGKVLRGEDHPMHGKKHSEETRAQMSASRMGDPRPKTEEWRQNQSEFMKNNNPTAGGLSEEHKQKVSAARIEKNIKNYTEKGIDISETNIRDVLERNNKNIRKTAQEIGCDFGVIQRFCVRHNIDVSQNMLGDNNPKRMRSIIEHAERGIDISTENILKIFKEHKNVANTAKIIGCKWRVIQDFCIRNNLLQNSC